MKDQCKNLLVKVDSIYRKIYQKEIFYFQSSGKFVEVCFDNKKYTIRKGLKELITELGPNFIRIHKSYIVNIRKIESIDSESKMVMLNNGQKIPLSRGYKQEFFDVFIMG